jgi:hypothetical protein
MTQRTPLQIAGRRFTNCAAAAARHGARLAGANSADPSSVAVLDQSDGSPAAGALGRADSSGTSFAEVVDEQQHRVSGCFVPRSGEQVRALCQCPRELSQLLRLGRRRLNGFLDQVSGDTGVGGGDGRQDRL